MASSLRARHLMRHALVLVTLVLLLATLVACGSSSAGGGGGACEGDTSDCAVPCGKSPSWNLENAIGKPCVNDGEACMTDDGGGCGATCTMWCLNGVWSDFECSPITPTC